MVINVFSETLGNFNTQIVATDLRSCLVILLKHNPFHEQGVNTVDSLTTKRIACRFFNFSFS